MGIEPVFKLVDTCAAEFEAVTPYYYSTYEAPYSVVGRPHLDDEARVSRRSAVATKATGFPIARFAATLAVGSSLDELRRDSTGTTRA
ncbi:MAG: hypothetical protein ACKOV8_01765, partial [Phycisphaerales bacterium]